MMIKFLKYLAVAVVVLLTTGCSDDDLLRNDGDTGGELPVEFTFGWPGITATRGFDDATVKTKFSEGDVIHIVGTFITSALQEDGTYEDGITARYGALKYNSKTRQWEAVAGNRLTWPSISTKGKFYAYYLSSSTGLITSVDDPITVSLSDVTPQSDPLMVPETEYLEYGHAVNLQFEHLCTYLNLIDLEPMVASNYFFTTETVGISDETGGSVSRKPFNNAFQLTLTTNPGTDNPQLAGTPQLNFEFIRQENPTYNNEVFISGKATTLETEDSDGEMKQVTNVGYFLEPGLYDTFDVKYSAIAPDTYKYLTYTYSNIPPAIDGVEYENIPPNLKAGTTYTLTVTKSPGVTIVNPPPGDGWDEEGEPEDIVVKDFLRAVKDGTGYTTPNGTEILEAVPGGTKLLRNVNFKNYNYEIEMNDWDFLPDISEGQTFDGNYHYISNLGCPLIRYNYGSIINLGIKGAKIEADSREYAYGDVASSEDRSRHGAICMWNRPEGKIENVRISDVSMTISVVYTNPDEDGGEVHNVGCVVGSNTGRISEVYLGDTFTLNVNGSDVKNAEVLIGGFAGQNAGSGTISDISMLNDDFKMTITNNCSGELGSYSVGGIVGSSSGFISGVILSDVAVNCRQSSGVVSYLGGMAGKLEVSEGSSSYMKSCILGGAVEAGTVRPSEYIDGQAYTGGMVGYDNMVSVTDCRSSVSVTGSATVESNVTYGTGGAFGRIASPSDFFGLIAYGARLQAPGGQSNTGANYVGNFAGIGPENQSWADYENKNIIYRSFNTLDPIGIFM